MEDFNVEICVGARAVLGCPNVEAPRNSYISNGTLLTRTFLCKTGSIFPDSRQRTRTIHCSYGRWIEPVDEMPACVGESADSAIAIILLFEIVVVTVGIRVLYLLLYTYTKPQFTMTMLSRDQKERDRQRVCSLRIPCLYDLLRGVC